jgi:hypothetical protein
MRRLLGLALLILWEVLPRAGLIPSLFLPPLTETLRALVAGGGEYLRHLLLSLYAIGLSMLAACGLRPAACGLRHRHRRRAAHRLHCSGPARGAAACHGVPLGLSTERGVATSEITRTEAPVGDLAHERRFFRPFGGGGLLDQRLFSPEALEQLQQGGYTRVLWNTIPEDWAYPEGWVERALRLSFAREHALIVLHDLPTGAMDRLDHFLHAAKDRGAVFRQDFPADCVPMERGRLVGPIEPYLQRAA